MLEDLRKDQEIQDFLSSFPKEQWNKCIYYSILYGIRQIKQILSNPKISAIETLINIRGKVSKSRRKSSKNHETPQPKLSKFDRPNTSLPGEIKEKNPQNSKRYSSPTMTINNDKKQRIVPKYLKNVQSKIKDDVQKDLALHNHKKETLNSPHYRMKYNKSLPDLLEVKEPNTCSIEKYRSKDLELGMGKLAEKFLNNPYARVLSPS